MTGFWDVIRHQVLIPLALPIALVSLALLMRLTRVLWFRFKRRGFPPLVVRAADDSSSRAFAARLSEYLSQDAPGPAVVIPPGGGLAQPTLPIEQWQNPSGWMAQLISLVLASEPTFDVHLEYATPSPTVEDPPTCRVIVQISRTPGNRVLAADTIQHEYDMDLIDACGGLIIHSIRRTPVILRNTPRWEQWGPGVKGYSAYRRALDYERSGDNDRALKEYDKAIRYEPGHFLICIGKAALLEVMGRFKDAVRLYRTCDELWPEHIETAYRLAASYANAKEHTSAECVLKNIKMRLARRALWKGYGRTWLPWRWNVGERHYWSAWLRRHPLFFGSNKRHEFRVAVDVAQQVRSIGRVVSPDPCNPADERTNDVSHMLAKMASLTTRRSFSRPDVRLFHPELTKSHRQGDHDHGLHNSEKGDDMGINPEGLRWPRRLVKPRGGIGWLAHYNAACFFSLALKLKDNFPPGFDEDSWTADCARAAIRELGHVRRDPRSEIEPDWYQTDPELQPLREYYDNTRWTEFVGLRPNASRYGPVV